MRENRIPLTRKRSRSCTSRPPILLRREQSCYDSSSDLSEEAEAHKNELSPLHSMKMRVGSLIQNGIVEGQRFALSSDLWRYAKATAHCDLLITFRSNQEVEEMRQVVAWLVDIIKTYEPQLRVEVRHHSLKDCYAIYLTADYKSLLKGAELCHIKKQVKSRFGGGLREFSFEEAQCFAGIEGRNTFLTDMERALIVKQMVDMMRAPCGGLALQVAPKKLKIPEGMAIVPRLISTNLIENVLPLHSAEFLKHLQQKWVLSVDEQPLDEIRDYFGTEIAMYFSWLGHMTTALWFPALLGSFGIRFAHVLLRWIHV
ncbi:hypothetical protein Y032_0135g1933 [Ancylostoma ceylanicum]|nr:hypothetical protein Y032_0135g1933 [Ancylostoma ceylanicum]